MVLMVPTEGVAIGTAAVAMAMVEGIGLVDAGSLGPWAAPSSAGRSQRPITTGIRRTAISRGAGSISGADRFASKHGAGPEVQNPIRRGRWCRMIVAFF